MKIVFLAVSVIIVLACSHMADAVEQFEDAAYHMQLLGI